LLLSNWMPLVTIAKFDGQALSEQCTVHGGKIFMLLPLYFHPEPGSIDRSNGENELRWFFPLLVPRYSTERSERIDHPYHEHWHPF